MAIRATCDGCFMEFTVADDKAGKVFKCKECGGAVRVPRKGAQPSAPRPSAAAPPPQRRSAGGAPKSSPSKKKKKRSNSSAGAGALVPLLLGLLVLAGAGVGGYVLYTSAGGEGNAENAASADAADGNAVAELPPGVDPLSEREQTLLKEFRQMIASFPGSGTSHEQRMAAFREFTDKHGVTNDELMAIVNKDAENRKAANKVDTNWQPLQISAPLAPAWPTRVQVSIAKSFADPTLRVPTAQTPFLLASRSVSGGAMRDVINLADSQQIGSWQNEIVVSGNEQLSPYGKLVLLQKGVKPPITFHIVDAASGNTLQQITSPDVLQVRSAAFVGPGQLMVITPPSEERSTERNYRVLLFDATTGKETARYERVFHYIGGDNLSFSPDGKYLLASGRGRSIEVCEVATGKQVCALDMADEIMQSGQLKSVAFSPDGRQIGVLEEKPMKALRLHLVDSATGKITRKIDLYGSTMTLGGSHEMQLHQPLVWFPDNRHALIAKLAVIDTATGRRIWQAQGEQSGIGNLRHPTTGGVLYQVNGETTTTLETSPIDFPRITAAQQAWPSDALLAPGMSVWVDVDLTGGGLQSLNDAAGTALAGKLERQGFEVSVIPRKPATDEQGADADSAGDTADVEPAQPPVPSVTGPVLQVRIEGEFVAYTWTGADAQPIWQQTASNAGNLVTILGHARNYPADRAGDTEGIARLLAWPTPYFIAADGWTLPIIAQIDHGE